MAKNNKKKQKQRNKRKQKQQIWSQYRQGPIQLNTDEFMLTPFHPNWDVIYKELNANGVDTLHNLPVSILQQMNEADYRSIPLNDSEISKWAMNVDPNRPTLPIVDATTNLVQDNSFDFRIEGVKESLNPTERIRTLDELIGESRYNQGLDALQDELIEENLEKEQRINEQVRVEEIWDERNKNQDALSEEGLERWKSQQKDRELQQRQQEYEDWMYSQDYFDQQNALNRKQREANIAQQELAQRDKDYQRLDDESLQREEGNKKWNEVQKNKSQAEAEAHYRQQQQQQQRERIINDTWDQRDLEQEYQNLKNRLEYENNKPYHGPITKEVADMQEEFKLIEEARNQMNMYNDYEQKANEWRKNNPEEAAKLDSRREAIKNGKNVAEDIAEETVTESAEEVSKNLKKSTLKNFGHLMNGVFAISDFKDAKEAGKSNTKALLHAGAEFAKGELLGGWYPVAMLAKSAPTLAVSAVEGLNTMSRSMNSTQRRQLFGDAQFMDTQQLATMRQSGMELAKMSQYNLQQALMGNEAEYMHRL